LLPVVVQFQLCSLRNAFKLRVLLFLWSLVFVVVVDVDFNAAVVVVVVVVS